MTKLSAHGRNYDSATLHVIPARNIRGESCLQLSAYPDGGLDPHALADLPYPSPEMAHCGAVADAAQNALLTLNRLAEMLADPVEDGDRDAMRERIALTQDDLRAALRAAKRIG